MLSTFSKRLAEGGWSVVSCALVYHWYRRHVLSRKRREFNGKNDVAYVCAEYIYVYCIKMYDMWLYYVIR